MLNIIGLKPNPKEGDLLAWHYEDDVIYIELSSVSDEENELLCWGNAERHGWKIFFKLDFLMEDGEWAMRRIDMEWCEADEGEDD